MKIPKIIHYCWFGPGFMPRQHKDMVRQWKKLMPDYTFMKWDETTFDIHCCSYTERAYEEGKYAFVSDVARCRALADYGGIYLDTDVSVYKRLDPYLQHAFFSANEIHQDYYTLGKDSLDENYLPIDMEEDVPCFGLLSSIIGAEPNHPIILDALEYYGVTEGVRGLRIATNVAGGGLFVVIDGLLARIATTYGYRFIDEKQVLEHDAIIYPTGIFGYEGAPNQNYSVSYHYSLNSWWPKTKEEQRRLLLDRYYLLGLYDAYKAVRRAIVKPIKRILNL